MKKLSALQRAEVLNLLSLAITAAERGNGLIAMMLALKAALELDEEGCLLLAEGHIERRGANKPASATITAAVPATQRSPARRRSPATRQPPGRKRAARR